MQFFRNAVRRFTDQGWALVKTAQGMACAVRRDSPREGVAMTPFHRGFFTTIGQELEATMD